MHFFSCLIAHFMVIGPAIWNKNAVSIKKMQAMFYIYVNVQYLYTYALCSIFTILLTFFAKSCEAFRCAL